MKSMFDNDASRDKVMMSASNDDAERLIFQTPHLRDVATMPEPKLKIAELSYVV